jgi:two-component system chemotaxis sensor kinase CheA
MDAVKTAVEAMKGTVEIQSVPGRGATFRLRLPITLAVIKSLLFEAGPRSDCSAIAEVARIDAGAQSVDGGRDPLARAGVSVVDLVGLRIEVSPGKEVRPGPQPGGVASGC